MKPKTIYNKIINLEKEQLNSLDLSSKNKFLERLGGFQIWYPSEAGQEHYRLLEYVSHIVDKSEILDIGSNMGCSAMALSTNSTNNVTSFDIYQYPEIEIFSYVENINFMLGNIINYPDIILRSNIIMLDTAHTGEFENEFYQYLIDIKYKGVLLLDDIHLNDAMDDFWNNIYHEKKDITHLGHFTGTGIVLF